LDLARLNINGNMVATSVTPFVSIGKAQVQVPPGSFLQATKAGEEALASLVLASLGKSKSVADLFCGIGPFALRIAEKAKVTAIDSDKSAIASLARAARLTTGIKPLKAEVRDLMREPLVTNELKEFDAVVFDPPRAGAEAQARKLAKSNVKIIVAVSCDPASFARDAEILVSGGYRLKSLNAVDQFKWTSHVEIVGTFSR
jgi:23S rRNA (uracil1939-C5)-methyltransferase